jgi:dimeric dUTPase (all-alpha-NTP-PPase superfamily)
MKKFTNEQLTKLLDSQDTLNSKYTSEQWREEVPLSSYLTAMDTEIAEYLESSPRVGDETLHYNNGWKWWKPTLENDNQNQAIEVIDVLHFALSVLMICHTKEEILKQNEDVSSFNYTENLPIQDILILKSVFVLDALTGSTESLLSNLYGLLGVMSKSCGRELTDIYDGYFLKNELNLQRILGGYIEGRYQKSVDGVEDNRSLDV